MAYRYCKVPKEVCDSLPPDVDEDVIVDEDAGYIFRSFESNSSLVRRLLHPAIGCRRLAFVVAVAQWYSATLARIGAGISRGRVIRSVPFSQNYLLFAHVFCSCSRGWRGRDERRFM